MVFIPVGVLLVGCAGMAGIEEVGKTVWGSSTRALEKARTQAITQEFRCPPQQCFDKVVAFVADIEKGPPEYLNPKTGVDAKEAGYVAPNDQHEKAFASPFPTLQIFIKDTRRHVVVLMGVPGAIDTTEVGVFFTAQGEGRTKVEISSLSKLAKIRAAEIIFSELNKTFSLVETATASSMAIASGSTAVTATPTSNP